MMTFLGNVVWFFMAMTAIIIFACVGVIGLAVMDYALDSDIKGALVRTLGPRRWLRRIRLNLLKIGKKYDTPEPNDIWSDNVKYTLKSDVNYDTEIHDLINRISGDSECQTKKN